jgi:hypothetical protein
MRETINGPIDKHANNATHWEWCYTPDIDDFHW